MEGDRYSVETYREALASLRGVQMDYDEAFKLCGAVKAAGLSLDDFEDWARASFPEYDPELTRRKWGSADENGRATAGTLVYKARERGWSPGERAAAPDGAKPDAETRPTPRRGTASYPVLKGIADPGEWDHPAAPDMTPEQMQAEFINAVFRPRDYVNVVTEHALNKHGKPYPVSGGSTKPAGLLAYSAGDEAEPYNMAADADPSAGAWVRANAVTPTGTGKNGSYRDADVTAFRIAIVECDELPIDSQAERIRALRLPCAAVTHSGGKSLHALVRVDAGDAEEYAGRVNYLYGVCEANGLKPDRSCKNPSRFTRLPGVPRGDGFQTLLATDQGCASWAEWCRFVSDRAAGRDAYEVVRASDVTGPNTPENDPELIMGMLRRGRKANITGTSKAGKSWAAVELAIALATGGLWLGKFRCVPSRVLYINTEIEAKEFENRVNTVCEALGIGAGSIGSMHLMNRRGMRNDMADLARELRSRAQAGEVYDVVIIDPIYKYLVDLDENAAGDIGGVCRDMDAITECGSSVVYVHHHAKGFAGARSAIDRGSGSGVWARDPDLLIDLTALDVSAREDLPPDLNAQRVTVTARSFPPMAPFAVEFACPLHRLRPELDGLPEVGSADAARAKGGSARADQRRDENAVKLTCLEGAIRECLERGQTPTRANVLEGLNARLEENGIPTISRDTLNRWTSKDATWCGYAPNTREDNALQPVARYDRKNGDHVFEGHYPWDGPRAA